jgi:hypothetical protein
MMELRSVLDEWELFRLSRGKAVPAIDGKQIAFHLVGNSTLAGETAAV